MLNSDGASAGRWCQGRVPMRQQIQHDKCPISNAHPDYSRQSQTQRVSPAEFLAMNRDIFRSVAIPTKLWTDSISRVFTHCNLQQDADKIRKAAYIFRDGSIILMGAFSWLHKGNPVCAASYVFVIIKKPGWRPEGTPAWGGRERARLVLHQLFAEQYSLNTLYIVAT